MKTHKPWSGAGWRKRCQVWALSLEGGRQPFSSISQFTQRYKARMERVLCRHLAKGLPVKEAGRTEWRIGSNCFIEPFKSDPVHLAEHIVNRAVGFGFTLQLLYRTAGQGAE